MLKIRKNDIVVCCCGKDKGKKGKVLAILPSKNRAIVEGINFIKKHTRKTREDQQGGIVQREASVNISNLKLFCNKCSKPVRVGMGQLKDGTRIRVCKKCKEVIG
ncbi:MAG: 50S ribosomal protein L24 [Candidatus Omnitrophica bacterium]|nr:50S ribosomal protein L24 [Candidatus Omnitrophota bacterium]